MKERNAHSFNIDEAVKHGVNKAVILYNIRYWLEQNLANRKNIHDGYVWTFNSARAFAELFPYIKPRSISRYLSELEEAGELISGTYNKVKYDKTKWYSMPSYAIDDAISQNDQSIGQIDQSNSQIDESTRQIGEPIPDSKPNKKPYSKQSNFNETEKKEILDKQDFSNSDLLGNLKKSNSDLKAIERKAPPFIPLVPPSSSETAFADFWKAYPKKVGKRIAKKSYEKQCKEKGVTSAISTAIEKYKQLWKQQKTKKQFIPHASTWLNGQRWKDEIEIGASQTYLANNRPADTYVNRFHK